MNFIKCHTALYNVNYYTNNPKEEQNVVSLPIWAVNIFTTASLAFM